MEYGSFKSDKLRNKWLVYEDPFMIKDKILGLKGSTYLDVKTSNEILLEQINKGFFKLPKYLSQTDESDLERLIHECY